jgi:predicted ester cyclase
MSVEDNKAVVRSYLERVNARDLASLDAFFAAQIVANGQSLSGTEYIHLLAPLFAALPDVRITLEEVIAEGDTVAGRGTFRGTHRGELLGIAPTGKDVAFSATGMWHLRDGKITDLWFNRDMLSVLGQLGATITPPVQVAGQRETEP